MESALNFCDSPQNETKFSTRATTGNNGLWWALAVQLFGSGADPLLRHCFEWLQHCTNITTLCCAENEIRRVLRMPTKHQAVFANFTVYFLFSTMYTDLVPNY